MPSVTDNPEPEREGQNRLVFRPAESSGARAKSTRPDPEKIGGPAERLERGAKLLELIDDRRKQAENPSLGSGIERFLVQRELGELEEEISCNPGPLRSFAAKGGQTVRRYRL